MYLFFMGSKFSVKWFKFFNPMIPRFLKPTRSLFQSGIKPKSHPVPVSLPTQAYWLLIPAPSLPSAESISFLFLQESHVCKFLFMQFPLPFLYLSIMSSRSPLTVCFPFSALFFGCRPQYTLIVFWWFYPGEPCLLHRLNVLEVKGKCPFRNMIKVQKRSKAGCWAPGRTPDFPQMDLVALSSRTLQHTFANSIQQVWIKAPRVETAQNSLRPPLYTAQVPMELSGVGGTAGEAGVFVFPLWSS